VVDAVDAAALVAGVAAVVGASLRAGTVPETLQLPVLTGDNLLGQL